MSRAYSVADILSKKYKLLEFEGEWRDAFGTPEAVGTWLVWGGTSNGKTSFTMQLCKELAKFGRVIYDSLEQGASKTLADELKRQNMRDVSKRLIIVQEPLEMLSQRLLKPKSPAFVVVDSIQYCHLSYKGYQQLKELHRDKLIIFISHAKGKEPMGTAAQKVVYDVDQKIYIEGFKAFSLGRNNAGGQFTIWHEGALKHWGTTETTAA